MFLKSDIMSIVFNLRKEHLIYFGIFDDVPVGGEKMNKIYYAKSKLPNGSQPTVKEHLSAVAKLAKQYGEVFGRGEEARVAGLLHDFGKYSDDFAEVLQGNRTKVDHAMCGAAFLTFVRGKKRAYRPLIEAVNGHHSGLMAFDELANVFQKNYRGENLSPNGDKTAAIAGEAAYREAADCFRDDFPDFSLPVLQKFTASNNENMEIHNIETMLFTRMLFSCLVDADYSVSALDKYPQYLQETERMQFEGRLWLEKLLAHQRQLFAQSASDPSLNQIRNELFEQCGKMGDSGEGLFTLTAPTGTGKTLALLHFALRHCLKTGKRRIIVVLPFLTLAEQNTATYEKIIPDIVVDHSQSHLSEDAREFALRWSVPFIITTSVKFFESLFAGRPTDCRKLHHIADSVVIFDEAQSLPTEVTETTLEAVNELCRTYRCTMVLSSATQPDFDAIPNVGWKPREIMPDNPRLFAALRRTHVEWRLKEPTSLEEIAGEMAALPSVCAIVNLRKHAGKLFCALKELCQEDELFFITTDLCMAHRRIVVAEITRRQKAGLPCRVVATQCIEAGVDLDFDVMYRALAPLDSIIQAAGRCNRNGRLAGGGRVVVFEPEEEGRLYPGSSGSKSGNWYENAAVLVKRLCTKHPLDIDSPAHMKEYYQELFADQADKAALRRALQRRDFAETEKEYELISNKGMKVIIPIPREISVEQHRKYQEMTEEARENGITPLLMREAASLTVTVPKYQQEKLDYYMEWLPYAGKDHERSEYYVLRRQYEEHYTRDMGLQLPEEIAGGGIW